MDNPHMFDELTNRLNKVKRPDSGIHNSGEFISENDKLDKSDEQVDSGRDSDPADADAADGSGAAKKGGFMKSFKKIFKIRRKSRSGKIKGDKLSDDEKVVSSQYKAASEPDVINCGTSKEPSLPRSNTGMPPKRYNDSPNANDFTSDDDEIRTDEKKSTLKDAPGFIRSSLRKLKLKKKKSGGMDSAEVTPAPVKRTHPGAPPPVSPKKSPKKPRSSSRSSHGSDQTEPISDSYTKDYTESEDGNSSRTDSLSSQPLAVNLKDDLQPYQPVIESSAARDKIRVAPRGRKRPTRVRTQSKAADVSDKISQLSQITEDDSHDDEKSPFIETPKKNVKEIPKTPTQKRDDDTKHKIIEPRSVKVGANVDKAFDSVLSSLTSNLNKSNESLAKKSPELKSRVPTTPPVKPKPLKPPRECNERRNTEGSALLRKSNESNTPAVRRNTDGSTLKSSIGVTLSIQKNTETTSSRKSLNSNKGSIDSLNRQSLKNSISLGDLVQESDDISLAPRSRSFQKSIVTSNNEHRELSESKSEKEESPNKNRYDKYRKSRSSTIPDNDSYVKETVNSKSVEDVSILNKENNRRSGNFIDPLSTFYQKDVDVINRENFINETRLAMENENIRKSKEQLKKSSSRHSLNETTFAITSTKNINAPDPIIPYNNHASEELSSSPDKPRKLQQRRPGNEKSPRKPRPQSVTIRSTDTSIIFGKVSGARSYGDIRSLIDSQENEKVIPIVQSPTNKTPTIVNYVDKVKLVEKPAFGKSKSIDVQPVTENVKVKADDVPEFKRMSLRKIPKTEDYLPKEIISDESKAPVKAVPAKEPVKEPVKDGEENHVLSNIKTTLKHVEPKPSSIDMTKEVEKQESPETIKRVEKEPNKEKIAPSPAAPEVKSIDTTGSVELREEKEKPPAFHRISLKKVEKRNDYSGNDKESSATEETNTPILSPNIGKEDNKPIYSDVKKQHNITATTPLEESHEKPKPPVKVKPFQFQSHDVNTPENKVSDNFEKPKPAPLSQTAKMPYFRKSIDIQENPNPHGNVPAWIAMARERQRDEAPEKAPEAEKVKELPEKAPEKLSEDVNAESLVKPSAMMKPKPTPKPKPSVPAKPEPAQQSTSPPAVAKRPPPVSQRPTLGRFNAKTDLPNKDACMVCQKTVYVLERCEVNKKTLHRACAKCHVCNRTLNVGDIFISDEKVSCRQHR